MSKKNTVVAHIMRKKSSKIRLEEKSEDRIKGTKTAVAIKFNFRQKSCDHRVNSHSGVGSWLASLDDGAALSRVGCTFRKKIQVVSMLKTISTTVSLEKKFD